MIGAMDTLPLKTPQFLGIYGLYEEIVISTSQAKGLSFPYKEMRISAKGEKSQSFLLKKLGKSCAEGAQILLKRNTRVQHLNIFTRVIA